MCRLISKFRINQIDQRVEKFAIGWIALSNFRTTGPEEQVPVLFVRFQNID
jgi:hypothetical protein